MEGTNNNAATPTENPAEGEKLSKNAQKKLQKQQQAAEAKAKKDAEKAAKAAAQPETAKKEKKKEEEEELDPAAYFENRDKQLKEYGQNVYPHKFAVSISLPDFRNKYNHLERDQKLVEVTESVAGRVVVARSAAAALHFFDIKGEGVKLQVLADKRHYVNQEHFDQITALVKRGDIVGIKGIPARSKSKEGELSIIPTEIVMLSPCLHMLPRERTGLKDQETRYRQRYLDIIMNDHSTNIQD